jgi:hypothetical protein
VATDAVELPNHQDIPLESEVLIGRGYAHIADRHSPGDPVAETQQSRVYEPKIDAWVYPGFALKPS